MDPRRLLTLALAGLALSGCAMLRDLGPTPAHRAPALVATADPARGGVDFSSHASGFSRAAGEVAEREAIRRRGRALCRPQEPPSVTSAPPPRHLPLCAAKAA